MDVFMAVLTWIGAAVVYFTIGWFATRWYAQKVDEIGERVWKERQISISVLKEIIWTILCFFVWWLVLPYELFTGFKQWNYPHCDPDYRGEGEWA